jgi:hypothetical protein
LFGVNLGIDKGSNDGFTENGQAYSWGINSDDRLGLGADDFVKIATNQITSKGSLVVVLPWRLNKKTEFSNELKQNEATN